MPFKLLIVSTFLALPLPSVAEMSFSEYPLPPRATAYGSQGQTLVLGCGQGGSPSVTLIGPRPVGGPEEFYVLAVDGAEEALVAARCDFDGCHLEFDTVGAARDFLTALALGTRLEIGFYRNGPGGVVPLAGAAAALGALYASGCPKP